MHNRGWAARGLVAATIAAAIAVTGTVAGLPAAHAAGPAFINIVGPAGSDGFGTDVVALANGNVVITDPDFDGTTSNVGAVYLYDGSTRALISTLTGSTANDAVGSGGVTALPNGHFVVHSPNWDNGAVADAGAVTWVNGSTGLNGVVSTANSLHGTTNGDRVGSGRSEVLANGNFIVRSTNWDNGAITNAGAVTWANGTTGITGPVTTTNSLHGTTANDNVGSVVALTNGNYVVRTPNWDNGATSDAGAVTWANGTTGITGAVTTTNSLHGTTALDRVGGIVEELTNGNYVVASPNWDDVGTANVGAVTWADGTTGITGAVTTTNSLHGTTTGDAVGTDGVTGLANGNYVVGTNAWDNGGAVNAGAVIWGNGTTGITGPVTTTNSLHGTTAADFAGVNGVAALTNGNYVVISASWDNGATTDVGAVTWADGTTGITGAISTTNSLHGTKASDQVGRFDVTPLTNGNYVVSSPFWDNGAFINVGAVTWGNGTTGTTGPVTTTNSLHGSTNLDNVGAQSVFALANGNYVVNTALWNNGAIADAGAVTWGNGTTGISGPVTTSNSLHGSLPNEQIGASTIVLLTNGNYLVVNQGWANGAVANAGAVTWADGTTGIAGPLTTSNSLHGSSTNDEIGSDDIKPLANGNYVVVSPDWDDPSGPIADAGAVTWGDGTVGISGAVSPANSLTGSTTGGFAATVIADDVVHGSVIVGHSDIDRVTWMVFSPGAPTAVSAVGGDSSAQVSWTAPALNGGDAPSYTATASPGGATCTTSSTSCTVPGLTNGVTYSFTVQATNAAGPGPVSTASNAVVPHVPLPATFHGSETLRSGRSMPTNRYLLSKDARTLLGLRADGNLILVVNDQLVFQSNTAGQGVTQMLMNRNGALQLLNGSGAVVFSTNTTKRGARLEVLDGRAVVRSGSKIQFTMGAAINPLKAKSSNRLGSGGTLKLANYLRSTNKQCALAVLGGEIVTWGPGGVVNYRSNTAGSGGILLKLQSSGNLQLLRANKTVAYQTNTAGRSPKLTITNTCATQLTARNGVLFQAP